MSYHFHRLRRRRALEAAKAAQDAVKGPQSAESAKVEQEYVGEEKAAQEPSKASKKAPKKKGDAK